MRITIDIPDEKVCFSRLSDPARTVEYTEDSVRECMVHWFGTQAEPFDVKVEAGQK